MIDKKELFKAYKEKVLKLNSRSSIIRCSNNILKKYVMDLTLFTDSYQQELLTWLLSDTIEEIIVDENSIENKFKTKIANLDKNQPIINDFDAVLGYNGLLDLDKTKQKLEEKKIRLISDGLAEINATNEIDKQLRKLLDLHKSRDMYVEDRKKLLREQDKFMLSCLKRIDNIDNKNIEVQKQSGNYTLYAGYKFVYGKIDKTTINAPLILVPITIERRGLIRVIKHSTDREIIINKPLLMLIESISNIKTNHTFNINLSDENWINNLENSLFKDCSNIKYIKSNKLLAISDKHIDDNILSIYDAACIGIFNVSTSIYNDYTNMELLEPNNLIDELIYGTNKKQYNVDNIELNLISTLDSSQEQAVYKSNLNNNLVIYGPPGTGKSQVITNIVADAISKDKRVLLVSEKKTALDVVHNRLGKLNKYALLIDDSGSIKHISRKVINTEDNYYLNHSSAKDKIDLAKQVIRDNLNKLNEMYLELTLENFEDTLSLYYKEAKKSLEADQLALFICNEYPELLDISYRDLLQRLDNITDNQIKNIDLKSSQLLIYLGNKSMLDMRLEIEKINIYKSTQDKIKDLHMQLKLVSKKDLYRMLHLYNDIINILTSEEFLIDNQVNCLEDKKFNKLNLDNIIKLKGLANKYSKGIKNQKNHIEISDIDTIVSDKNIDKIVLKHKYEGILNKIIVEQPRFIFEPITKDYDISIENITVALKLYYDIMNLGTRFNFNFNDTWNNIEKAIKAYENIEYVKMLKCINNIIYTYKETTNTRIEIDINKIKEICKKPQEFMYNNIAIFKNKQNLVMLLSARQLLETEINKNKSYINKGLQIIDYIKNVSNNIGNSYEEVCNYLYNSKKFLETEIYNIDKEILQDKQSLYKTIKSQEVNTVDITNNITEILSCSRCEIKETLNTLRNNLQEEIDKIEDLEHQLDESNIIIDNINNNELGKYTNEFYKIRNYDYTQITVDKLKEVELLDEISTNITKLLTTNDRNNLINGWLTAKIYKYTTSKLASNIIEYDKAVKYIEQTQQELISLVVDEIDYKLHLDMSNRIAMREIEFNDLKREATKLRRKKTARELVNDYFDLMKYLYPVWMMTPETVSDILPLRKDIFDIVIFDEASQMFLEKSLPSMYRAKKAIVAGDDKQLRPSSFFESNYMSEQYEDLIDNSLGIDTSLLDQAKYTFEKCNLQFHYRSRFKELIQFNNKAFYNSNLKIAPNLSKTIDGKCPIIYKNVHGIHCNNSNKTEAIEVANIVKQLVCNTNYTIGVVTLNYNQKELINSTIDELAADESNIEFATLLKNERNRIENNEDVSLFVKSIEEVQGDERDVIIFSLDRGKGEDGKLHTRLGPIAVEGGENRLNVALSRAKIMEYIIVSIEPEILNVEKSLNKGPKILKEFLQYARDINTDANKTSEDTNSKDKMVNELANRLRKLGWSVETHVGAYKYELDLAIYDNKLERYILGIETDGDTYHSSNQVIERDIARHRFLTSRGWSLARVWSRDWWINPDEVVKELDLKLKNSRAKLTILLEEQKAKEINDITTKKDIKESKKKEEVTSKISKETDKFDDFELVDDPYMDMLHIDLDAVTYDDISGYRLVGLIINDGNMIQVNNWNQLLKELVKLAIEENSYTWVKNKFNGSYINTNKLKIKNPLKVDNNITMYIESKASSMDYIKQSQKIMESLSYTNNIQLIIDNSNYSSKGQEYRDVLNML